MPALSIDFGYTECVPTKPHTFISALSASSAVFKLSYITDHNPAILTMKLLPRPHKAQNAGRAPSVEHAECMWSEHRQQRMRGV